MVNRDNITIDQPENHNASKDNTNTHNVSIRIRNTLTGNGTDYAIRKLRKDSPEIHAKVIAGEISPHAGMVAAGFRKKTATVSVDPKSFATAILRRFTSEEIREIIEALEVGAL